MDFRICQTPTASPAKPGGLPLTLGNRHERTLMQIKRRVRPGSLDLDQS